MARRRNSLIGRRDGGVAAHASPGFALPVWSPAPAEPSSPFKGVQWTFTLAGFLLYIAVITTNRLPLGEVAVLMALSGLFLHGNALLVPPYLKCLGVFFVWTVVGLTQTAFPAAVSEMLIELIKVLLIVLVAANALRNRAQLRLFMVFFLGCFAFFPVRGALSNYFVYGHTEQGRAVWNLMYSNPNDLAAMSLLQLSMAVALLATEPRGWVRRAALAGLFVLPMLILLTQSRGVFLGLLVFIAITFTGQRRRALLAVRLTVLLIVLAALAPSSVWKRMESLQHATSASTLEQVDGAEGSALQRYVIWQVALKIIREHPITGVGVGAYERTHQIYALSPEFNPTAQGPRDTHSLYLNVLAETGYPGFLLYMGMLVSVFWRADKVRRRCKSALPVAARQMLTLEAGLAGFMVATLFSSMPYLPHFLLHLVVLAGWTRIHGQELSLRGGHPAPVAEQRGTIRRGDAVPAASSRGAIVPLWTRPAGAVQT